jgi:proteasome lid subunit RPN8/RPN11
MQTPDVAQLRQEKLPGGKFPADSKADFRLHFAPAVHEAILKHAAEDTEVEICGIVVGNWGTDQDGPFAAVSHYIRCDSAAKKFAEVTFTHESWDHINREMDTKYSELKIVGWYHSHPDFGIFLSDRDQFIHQHFFSGPGQLAFVVDPVRQLEGVFVWKSGATQLLDHYWVGSQIKSVEASRRPESPKQLTMASIATAGAASSAEATPLPATSDNAWTIATRLLAWAALFLMGYLLSGLKSNWDRRMIETGAVYHYGVWKGLRPALEIYFNDVQKRLDDLAADVQTLSVAPAADESEEAAAKRRRQWQDLQKDVAILQDRMAEINSTYMLSPEERRDLAEWVAFKTAELSGRVKAQEVPDDASRAGGSELAPAPGGDGAKGQEASRDSAAGQGR